MKKMNVLKGLLALAVVFLFAQCTDNKGTSTEIGRASCRERVSSPV